MHAYFPTTYQLACLRSACTYLSAKSPTFIFDCNLYSYRWNDLQAITPLFAFGYGLSYTTFEFSHLTVSTKKNVGPSFTFNITNTGLVYGQEVAQLYISMPNGTNSPLKQLAGFEKVKLNPGFSISATISLSLRDVSIYNATLANGTWVIPAGIYTAYVGSSSTDLYLTATFTCSTVGCKEIKPPTIITPTIAKTIAPTAIVYKTWVYIGCYTDSVINRQMNTKYVRRSNDNTVKSCQQYCLKLKFIYAGPQYSKECWCSNALPALGPSTNCNMPCTGNITEICGGPSALSIYEIIRTSESIATYVYYQMIPQLTFTCLRATL